MFRPLFAFLAVTTIVSANQEIRIFPETIELNGADDRQSITIQLVDAEGITQDITGKAKLKFADDKPATLHAAAIAPKANGKTKLVARFNGLKASVPVTITNATSARDLSFRLDVMPIFMKHGCNNGSCHGAAVGKDGFRLSLFGYDPAGDYHRLTREMVGRRIDLAVPEKSMMLEKSIGAVQHSAGDLFGKEHRDYKTLLNWIKAGAPDDTDETAVPLRIELLPRKVVFKGTDTTQKTVVMAHYSDGSARDVTNWALYLSNNESVAEIDESGTVKPGARGGAFVFARFDKYTVGSEVIVLPKQDKYNWPDVPENNYIDTLVYDKLRKLRMVPSDLCSDDAFVRRVYLDVIGLLPTRAEYEAFIADTNADKRSKLIDDLLARPESGDMWAMKWGELLQIRASNQATYGRDPKAMWMYSKWIKQQIHANRPWDEMVRDLVTGNGSNLSEPQSNYYTSDQRATPEKMAENLAQIFMGTRIQCAQCHNHPFDRWTMDDYYGFSAFFAGIRNSRGSEGREVITYNLNAENSVPHIMDGRPMSPKFLGGDTPKVEGKDPRVALANWLTGPDNEAFATTMSNMVWAHFFGRGIIDPVDDARISNPPSNRELLDALGARFIESKFDYKTIIRDICNSRTYQLSSETNATNTADDRYFSHAYVRRLRAEVLLDCITRVTETTDRFTQMPMGSRAVEIYSGSVSNYFLTTFGRASRQSVCSCEVSTEANLSQALHLINGDTVGRKIQNSAMIRKLLAEKDVTPTKVIEDLYIRTLSRKPTDKELRKLLSAVEEHEADEDAAQRYADSQMRRNSSVKKYRDQINDWKKGLKKLNPDRDAKAIASLEKKIQANVSRIESTERYYKRVSVQHAYEDILWGLINSTEFAFNH